MNICKEIIQNEYKGYAIARPDNVGLIVLCISFIEFHPTKGEVEKKKVWFNWWLDKNTQKTHLLLEKAGYEDIVPDESDLEMVQTMTEAGMPESYMQAIFVGWYHRCPERTRRHWLL